MSCSPDHRDGYIPGSCIRTDLAIEAYEAMSLEKGGEVPGVSMEQEEADGIQVNRMEIFSEEGARNMGKKQGHYTTLEVPGLRQKNTQLQEKVAMKLGEELRRFIDMPLDKTVFVVGLGNWNVTPDAIGPRVVKDVFITRHILSFEPDVLGEGFRPVSVLAPGVLGLTGVETGEIILGVVEKIKPDMVVTVDALAARNLNRLNTTIQIADTGINPGSGVGNKRMAINNETIGIPVIAIGVPTVIDAAIIALDAMKLLSEEVEKQGGGKTVASLLKALSPQEQDQLVHQVLQPYSGNLMVTPKEVDTLIEDISRVISGGINSALHPSIDTEEAAKYLH